MHPQVRPDIVLSSCKIYEFQVLALVYKNGFLLINFGKYFDDFDDIY